MNDDGGDRQSFSRSNSNLNVSDDDQDVILLTRNRETYNSNTNNAIQLKKPMQGATTSFSTSKETLQNDSVITRLPSKISLPLNQSSMTIDDTNDSTKSFSSKLTVSTAESLQIVEPHKSNINLTKTSSSLNTITTCNNNSITPRNELVMVSNVTDHPNKADMLIFHLRLPSCSDAPAVDDSSCDQSVDKNDANVSVKTSIVVDSKAAASLSTLDVRKHFSCA